MSLKINGSTSGSVTLDAPATGSDVSLTLPGSVGTSGQLLSTNGSGVLSFVNGGKILQVQSVNKQDTFSTSSTSFVDVTGLSVSITPSTTGSKILILADINLATQVNTVRGGFRVLRDSTAINVGTTSGSRTSSSAAAYSAIADDIEHLGCNFLDSPNTTSAVTYKIQIAAGNANTIWINRGSADGDAAGSYRTASNLTVLEVAA